MDSQGRTTTFTHDSAQRLIATNDPLNRTTAFGYDANGRQISSQDPLNRTSATEYTQRAEPETITDGLLKNTDSVFDENGNQTHRTNRRGKTHVFGYDAANRIESSTTPTGKATLTEYFKNDLVKKITEPSTQSTSYTYDSRLRPFTKIDAVATVTYGYNDADQPTTVTEGTDVITQTYDERGRLKSFTNVDGDLIQFRYNANGDLSRITYPPDVQHPAGKQVNYTYNARNLLESVTDWANRITTYSYDRLGRLTGTTRPNGTANIIAHDAADQLTSIKETANGKTISYLAFKHDAAGQITSRLRAPLLNSNFEQPSISAAYNDDNRIVNLNGQTVTHDDDGNMTFGPVSGTSGSISLTYNSRNQLTAAGGLSYTYDAEGRRRSLTDSGGSTRFTIAPDGDLLVKHNPDNSKIYYVYGLGLLYETNETGETKTHHYDQVGSTILRTDDSGSVIGRVEYSAYGLIAYESGDLETPFLYNGQAGVQTDSNGLLNMRARYYSPFLMRFLNTDPIGFSGGSNWFAFADGNPVTLSDPFGLKPGEGFKQQRASMNDGYGGMNSDGVYGYVDPFGDWHRSFCMSCHDANNPYAQRNMSAAIGGDLGWWLMGRDVLIMAAPIGIEAIAARETMVIAGAIANGGRATEVGLTSGEIVRIQNAANRISKPISLVGSRASGTAKASSDWDYVIEGMTNANKNAIKNSLPGAPIRIDQVPRNIDFLPGPLLPYKPSITFTPTN